MTRSRFRPQRYNHPIVGELTLAYEELLPTAEPGLVFMIYTAEPGSPSAERLRLLASWAAEHQSAHDLWCAPYGLIEAASIPRPSHQRTQDTGWLERPVGLDRWRCRSRF